LIGVADDKVQDAIAVIRQTVSPSPDPGVNRATLFVINVENFTQI